MRRGLILCTAALLVCACKPAARDQRSPAIPQADSPANPAEPASAPASALAPEYEAAMDLTGSQPPWSLRIRKNSLALSRPGRVDIMSENPGPSIASGAAVWSATAVGQGGSLKVTLRPGHCSVGMSDREYPYQATVETGGETLMGCAAPAGG
jgi:uncharacterized membrane protein